MCYRLQIAIGSGLDETYPLNLESLGNHFDIPVQSVYHGLKNIEQGGNIVLSEGVFQKTKLMIAIGNKELYSLTIAHEKLAHLLRLLT